MRSKPQLRYCGLLVAAISIAALVGCNGSSGSTGATGPAGPTGAAGAPGTAATNIGSMTQAQWSAQKLQGTVTNVNMNSGQPIVTFKVTNSEGVPLSGLGGADPSGFSNHFGFTIAKLVTPANPANNGNVMPSYWVNYEFVQPPATPTGTAAISGYPDPEYKAANLTDNGDGTYTYQYNLNLSQVAANALAASATFTGNKALADLGDLTYSASDTFRILILAGGQATGSGAIPAPAPVLTSANIVYDFVGTAPNTPITAPNDIVTPASCNACHSKLSMHANYMPPVQDTHACVVCHTDQMKFNFADARAGVTGTTLPAGTTGKLDGFAIGLFPNFIHKIHMGNNLSLQGYSFDGTPINSLPFTQFPQDVRNCNTCHTNTAAVTTPATVTVNGVTTPWPTVPPIATATAQGDNWNMAPGRAACGACHDTTVFSTNTNHGNGITTTYLDDSKCATCHTAQDIQVAHWPIYAPGTPNNTSLTAPVLAGNPYNVPNGLNGGTAHKLTWTVSKVTVDANYHPNITFAFFEDYSSTITPVTGYTAGATQMIPGFTGSPTLKLLVALPQDGIANPADYNYFPSVAINTIWNGTATGATAGSWNANADGSVTIIMTGMTLPAGTNMLKAVLGYGFMTQASALGTDAFNYTSYANGLQVATQASSLDCSSFPGTAAVVRRSILKPGACLSCHENLGFFTNSAFHSGTYNDPEACLSCHAPNATDHTGGVWSINLKEWIHGIHSGGLNSAGTALAGLPQTPRVNAYTNLVAEEFWNIQYPALLNDCTQCHVEGSYDFAGASNVAQYPNLLWSLAASGTLVANGNQVINKTGLMPLPAAGTIPAANSATGTLAAGNYPNGWIGSTATTYGADYMSPGFSGYLSASSTPAANVTAFNSAAGLALGSGWTVTYTPAVVGPPAVPASFTPHAAAATVLVTSPITSACSSCHDSPQAILHFQGNGGSYYAPRGASATLVNNEQCLICHGAGKTQDAQTVHMNFN